MFSGVFIVFVFFFFWFFFGTDTCGILARWLGIKPSPPALKGKVLTTGPPGKSLKQFYFFKRLDLLWEWNRGMDFSPSVPRAHHTILGKSAILFQPQCFVYRTVFQPPLLIFGCGEDHNAGKDWRQKEKRETENEVVGWHQQFNGLELGQILGDSETWHAAVHGVPNSWAWLGDWTTTLCLGVGWGRAALCVAGCLEASQSLLTWCQEHPHSLQMQQLKMSPDLIINKCSLGTNHSLWELLL